MTEPKYAPKREDGTFAYVRQRKSWGSTSESLVYAPSLKDARAQYGWTRELHVSISIRRATPSEVSEMRDYR